jgi:hypothetical protein
MTEDAMVEEVKRLRWENEKLFEVIDNMTPRPIESAPKDGSKIWIGADNAWVIGYFDLKRNEWRVKSYGKANPDRWMPLNTIGNVKQI